jgi:hypothetical protein
MTATTARRRHALVVVAFVVIAMLAADRPEPTGTPLRTTLAGIGRQSMARPAPRVGIPSLSPLT